MPTEKFSNNPNTTLNGGINNVVTSLVVTSAASFPTHGNFRILIDSEIMLVTAVAGTTFTVIRAQEGTAASTHTDTTNVDGVLTSGAVDALRSDLITSGNTTSLPTPEIAGRIYLANDGPYLYRDDNTNWAAFGPIYPFTPPKDSDFTWVDNPAGVVLDTSRGGIYLQTNFGTAALKVKAAPTTPYKITTFFRPLLYPAGNVFPGILWRESSTGKIVSLTTSFGGSGAALEVIKWSATGTTAWTYVAGYQSMTFGNFNPMYPMFFRIEDDGTNRNVYFGSDGYNFCLYHTISNTNFMTANQVGFGVFNAGLSGRVSGIFLNHWAQS